MPAKTSKLDNGLKIVTHKNENIGTVVIAVGVKVGSRYEDDSESGMSHVVEHMLYKGTSKRSADELTELVDYIGADANAYTGQEETVFYISCMKEHLEKGIEILSDQLLYSIFPEDELKKELKVIDQEIKMYLDDAGDVLAHNFADTAFKGHPLGRHIIGTSEKVLRYKVKDIVRFYEKYYKPKNMVLSIVGDVKHKDIVDLAEKYFSEKFGKFKKPELKEAKWHSGEKIQNDEQAHQTLISIGWPIDGRKDTTTKQRMVGKIVNSILGAGLSSKLSREIREKRGLAYRVQSDIHMYNEIGVFVITGGVDHEKAKEFLDCVLIVMKDFSKTVNERELQKAKNHINSNLYMQIENSKNIAIGHIRGIFSYKEPFNIEDQINAINSVSLNEVKDFVNDLIQNETVLSIHGNVAEKTFSKLKLVATI